MNDRHDLDQRIAHSLRARPLPAGPRDLATRAIALARQREAAALECRSHLLLLNRRIRILNAVAAVLVLAIMSISLLGLSGDWRPAIASVAPPEELVLREDAALEETATEPGDIAWLGLWCLVGASVFMAVERVMRSPSDFAWALDPVPS